MLKGGDDVRRATISRRIASFASRKTRWLAPPRAMRKAPHDLQGLLEKDKESEETPGRRLHLFLVVGVAQLTWQRAGEYLGREAHLAPA